MPAGILFLDILGYNFTKSIYVFAGKCKVVQYEFINILKHPRMFTHPSARILAKYTYLQHGRYTRVHHAISRVCLFSRHRAHPSTQPPFRRSAATVLVSVLHGQLSRKFSDRVLCAFKSALGRRPSSCGQGIHGKFLISSGLPSGGGARS